MGIEEELRLIEPWIDRHMRLGQIDKSGRLTVLMGLLERLREIPGALEVSDHVKGAGNQIEGSNKFVRLALERHGVEPPLKELGRKSSNLLAWIGPLLDWLKRIEFSALAAAEQTAFLDAFQRAAGIRLEAINRDGPLIARFNLGSSRAVIVDILAQAQEKKRAKDAAEYLVGAKLQLRFGDDAVSPKNINAPNRDGLADFSFGTSAIEVTLKTPDDSHIKQVREIIENTSRRVWLLVALSSRERWQKTIDKEFGSRAGRVIVNDIETFVGQNISEIGRFDEESEERELLRLFRIYNERWLPTEGAAGLKIVVADSNMQ